MLSRSLTRKILLAQNRVASSVLLLISQGHIVHSEAVTPDTLASGRRLWTRTPPHSILGLPSTRPIDGGRR